MRAALVTRDRMESAVSEGDLVSANQQYQALLGYFDIFSQASVESSQESLVFKSLLEQDSALNIFVSANDISEYQDFVETNGFPEEEMEIFAALDATESEIAQAIGFILDVDPVQAEGNLSDVFANISIGQQQNSEIIPPPPPPSVSEPSTTIGIFALGILGGGATLKRKLKSANSTEK